MGAPARSVGEVNGGAGLARPAVVCQDVLHEGPGDVKRPFDVFDCRSGGLVVVRHGSPWLIGVWGFAPDWLPSCPGELVRVKRGVLRAWVFGAGCGRLTRAGESGRWGRGGAHGDLEVWRRFADGVAAWEEAPVIHPVARGGPGCRAVLGGSIKRAAVLLELGKLLPPQPRPDALRPLPRERLANRLGHRRRRLQEPDPRPV